MSRSFSHQPAVWRKWAFVLWAIAVLQAHLACNRNNNTDADDRASFGQRKYVVGGQEVSATDPIASSTVVLINGAGKMRCSGTLISARLVVSAAHCFVDPGLDNSNLTIGFGINTGSVVTKKVQGFIAHPSYDPNRPLGETAPLFDVALIQLSEDAPSGSIPARIPDRTFPLAAGEPLVLAGFGLSYTNGSGSNRTGGGAGTLRKVSLPLSSVLSASKQLKLSSNDSQAVCSGDSGGPAFANSPANELVVTGVTSWGYSRCEDGLSVFTDVRQYSDWIVANSQGQLSADRLVGGNGQPPPDELSHPPAPAPYTAIVDAAYSLLTDLRQGKIQLPFGEIKDRTAGKYTRSFFFFFRNTEPRHYCVHLRGDGTSFSGNWGQKIGSYVNFDKVRISELANFDSLGCSWQSAKTNWYWYLE